MIKRLTLFLAGVLLLTLVISRFGLAEIIIVLSKANPAYIAVAALVQIAILLMMGMRQHVIGGFRTPFWKNFRVVMSGNFVNLIVPGPAIGGEPLKVYLLRDSHGISKATAVVAIDDFIEIFGTILMILVCLIFFVPFVTPGLTGVFTVFIIVVILAVTGTMKVLLTPKWLRKIVKWIVKKVSMYQNIKDRDYAKMFYDAFRVMLIQKRTLLALLLTMCMKVMELLILWLTFSSIGVSISAEQIIVLWSVIVIFLFVPWLPGSLGLVEFGAVTALAAMGMTGTLAASGILINRFITFWLVLALSAIAIYVSTGIGAMPDLKKNLGRKKGI